MNRIQSLPALALLIVAGCATPSTYHYPAVGTGWSRAPDLSVYVALDQAGQIAREMEVLCYGKDPGLVDQSWQREFGARHTWIAAALVYRYGQNSLAASSRRLSSREPCPEVPDDYWRDHYARLLHLLELRLYPKDYWST